MAGTKRPTEDRIIDLVERLLSLGVSPRVIELDGLRVEVSSVDRERRPADPRAPKSIPGTPEWIQEQIVASRPVRTGGKS